MWAPSINDIQKYNDNKHCIVVIADSSVEAPRVHSLYTSHHIGSKNWKVRDTS